MNTLAQLALKHIPYTHVSTMTIQQKTVVHYELFPYVFWSRSVKGKLISNICHCHDYGRCLCYLEIIRHEMVEQYWTPETQYEYLGGWYNEM